MHSHVVQPRPALAEEAAYDCLRSERLQQFHSALAKRQHGHAHAFVLDRLFMQDAQAKRLVEVPRRRYALHRDAEVIDSVPTRVLMRGCLP